MKKYDFGVAVGRFQVADLHYAHIKIIYDMLISHKKVLLLLGVPQVKGTNKDPLDFETRKTMILKQFPDIQVLPIEDHSSNSVWSAKLDRIVKGGTNSGKKSGGVFPKGSVVLYGGRDSFLTHYEGVLPTKEFPKINHWPGSDVRKKIGKTVKDSSSWREGQIYLTQNQYPRLFTTVDIAIIKLDYADGLIRKDLHHQVLLAQKEGETTWRFPGGFVDPSDNNLEEACRRELYEETDIEVDDFQYISSHLVDDWRYRNTPDKIMTNFFVGYYIYGSIFQPKDDICDLGWFPINKETEKLVIKGHIKMFINLKRYTKNLKMGQKNV